VKLRKFADMSMSVRALPFRQTLDPAHLFWQRRPAHHDVTVGSTNARTQLRHNLSLSCLLHRCGCEWPSLDYTTVMLERRTIPLIYSSMPSTASHSFLELSTTRLSERTQSTARERCVDEQRQTSYRFFDSVLSSSALVACLIFFDNNRRPTTRSTMANDRPISGPGVHTVPSYRTQEQKKRI
jgi:hypothetical protein